MTIFSARFTVAACVSIVVASCGGARAPTGQSESTATPTGTPRPADPPTSQPAPPADPNTPPTEAHVAAIVREPMLARATDGSLVIGWTELGANAAAVRMWRGRAGAWAELPSPVGPSPEPPSIELASGVGDPALVVTARNGTDEIHAGSPWARVGGGGPASRLVATAVYGDSVAVARLEHGARDVLEIAAYATRAGATAALGRVPLEAGRTIVQAEAALDLAANLWLTWVSCRSVLDVDYFTLVDCRADAARFAAAGARALPSLGATVRPDEPPGSIARGASAVRIGAGVAGPIVAFVRPSASRANGASPELVVRAWNGRAWATPSAALSTARMDRAPIPLAVAAGNPAMLAWVDADVEGHERVRVSALTSGRWADAAPPFDPLTLAPARGETDETGVDVVLAGGAPTLLVTRSHSSLVRLLGGTATAWDELALPARTPATSAQGTTSPPAGAGSPNAPRPIHPFSGASCAGNAPRFRWALPRGAQGGVRIELCRDRACTRVERTADATGTEHALSPPLAAGRWFWRLRTRNGATAGDASVTWRVDVTARAAPQTSCRQLGYDFDADGLDDTITGEGSVGGPRAWWFRGTSRGIGPNAVVAIPGFPQGDGPYAREAAGASDVNGDGFSDAWVATPSGRVHLYLGSATGLVLTPAVSLAPGGSASAHDAGDVNGDGYSDLVVADSERDQSGVVYVHLGGPRGWATVAAQTIVGPDGGRGHFGRSFDAGADVNADGFADLVVAAPYTGPQMGVGRVHVFLGSASGLPAAPSVSIDRPAGANERLERAAWIGDVNGDGFGDLAISSPLDHSRPARGLVFLYFGTARGPGTTPAITISQLAGQSTSWGNPVVGLGDVDGDGFEDLLIGSPTGESEGGGRAVLMRGAARGPALRAAQTLAPPGEYQTQYGGGSRALGDVNRDGHADVLVGLDSVMATEGHVYLGGARGLVTPHANDLLQQTAP